MTTFNPPNVSRKGSPWVDLHIHTQASDGDLTPVDVVSAASTRRLGAIAITDHDTVEGLTDAMIRGAKCGLEVVSGVEISVAAGDGRTFHLLGYGFDFQERRLCNTLRRLQKARMERNEGVLRRLERLGLPVDPCLLARCARGGQIGRTHIAAILVKLGYVPSVEAAFHGYLKKGSPAYVERFRLSAGEAIDAIRQAGGLPVLAHPGSLRIPDRLEMTAFVAGLVEKEGLMGIEVAYSDHATDQESFYRYLAVRYDLVMTGGSDFHGEMKPGIALGWGRGDLRVPYSWVQTLKQRTRFAQ